MAHEILEHDHVVLTAQAAWHGLGTVVQDAPTPAEALKLAKLDWTVEQWELEAGKDDRAVKVKDLLLNIRRDTLTQFGVVSRGYKPVQNAELAEFCSLLAEQGDVVRLESAGSIRNGAKVWFLLRGESFSVRGGDSLAPYICVSNGHDGRTAVRCTPTTVRVVCSNTLHMVIPRSETERNQVTSAAFVASHVGDVRRKVEDAKAALGLYGRSLETTRQVIDALAARDLSRDDVKSFLLGCYVRDFGSLPSNPKTPGEKATWTKGQDAMNHMLGRIEMESDKFGRSAWVAVNGYTDWLQHGRQMRKDAAKEAERRTEAALFGTDSQRAVAALESALAL
jgi:phage/plasmid-like protein (TIGR03299 family)